MLTQTYNISGIVLDYETNNPIENVNIFISDSNSGTITNNEGYFTLFLTNHAENNVDLNIRIIGYKEKNIPLDLSKSRIDLGEIYLITKSLELESVHIHSHKEESKQIHWKLTYHVKKTLGTLGIFNTL